MDLIARMDRFCQIARLNRVKPPRFQPRDMPEE